VLSGAARCGVRKDGQGSVNSRGRWSATAGHRTLRPDGQNVRGRIGIQAGEGAAAWP